MNREARGRGLHRHSSGVKVVAALVASMAFGAASVALLAGNTSLDVRSSAAGQPALAGNSQADPPPVGDTDAGDPRIVWADLPTSSAAPVLADGTVAWIAVVERFSGTPAESVLLRFDPAAGGISTFASFSGRPTALALAGDDVAIGARDTIVLVNRATGALRTVRLDQAPVPVGEKVSYVTALATVGGRLFAARADSTIIDEVDLSTGVRVGSYDVAGLMPSPATLAVLDGTVLVATTPFGNAGGAQPGSVLIDVVSSSMVKVDLGRPFGVATGPASSLLTSQAVPGGGVVEVTRAGGTLSVSTRAANVGRAIPWDGRWDLLAAEPDGSIWGAPQGANSIFRERPDGAVEAYKLPIRSIVPSIPPGATLSEEEYEKLSTIIRRPVSLASLSDGSLVFFVENGGGALGYIPAR